MQLACLVACLATLNNQGIQEQCFLAVRDLPLFPVDRRNTHESLWVGASPVVSILALQVTALENGT